MAVTSCIGDALNELLNVTRQVIVEDMLYMGEIPKTTSQSPCSSYHDGAVSKAELVQSLLTKFSDLGYFLGMFVGARR